ncbi:hypothetical protein [Dyella japonica]|uniref:Uncharacterized protein n=1 Tax=Dyella japonica TaxID=231455 RepID=A0ABV2JUE8_9GAMM
MSSYAEFLAIRDELVCELAEHFESKIKDMGDAVRGIGWFSSVAEQYAAAAARRAA